MTADRHALVKELFLRICDLPDDDRPAALDRACGDYRVLRKLGEGGMGVVYEVRQDHPVRRTLAFKLVKWGMDTEEVLARFESERQALAIATVRVRDHLRATIHGSGNVFYFGDPIVDSSITGSGDVVKIGG